MKKIIAISILLMLKINSYAQNVGIGTTTPQAKLSIGSTSQFQVDSVGNIKKINNVPYSFPSSQGTIGQVLTNNGTGTLSWQTSSGGGSAWGLLGTSGTNANTNFIGTTDSVALVFKVNNAQAGIIDPNYQNTFIGLRAGNANIAGIGNSALGNNALNSNTSGAANTALGVNALYSNTSGFSNVSIGYEALKANTNSSHNTAIGTQSLFNNTAGQYNVALGSNTLYNNTTGGNNTAVGFQAVFSNTTGSQNTGLGFQTLYNNTTGYNNTASGWDALISNTTGIANVGSGSYTLYNNTTGNSNTGFGYSAMSLNTTGNNNTAVGQWSLNNNTTGGQNTCVGYLANVNASNYSNSSSLGANAIISASNQIRFGDASVTSIGGQVGWSTLSDGRFKENVKEEVPGLKFINQLRPVTYHYNTKKFDAYIMKDMPDSVKAKRMQTEEAYNAASANTYTGFIAQEVEMAAQKVGYNFSGVDKPKNEGDTYSLRYAEFVVPLVKSVQEISAENTQLKADMALLKKQLEELKTLIQTNK